MVLSNQVVFSFSFLFLFKTYDLRLPTFFTIFFPSSFFRFSTFESTFYSTLFGLERENLQQKFGSSLFSMGPWVLDEGIPHPAPGGERGERQATWPQDR